MAQSDGYSAFMTLRNEALKNGLQDLSLDEINAEIALARLENDKNLSQRLLSQKELSRSD